MTWKQQWLDCLFLHFAAPAAAVARHVPPRLDVETFGGSAWISYVLFRLKLRPAWLPPVPGLSLLIELNIRTYVRHRGQSGIYFLRMLADNALASAAARLLTPLPYEHARFAVGQAASSPADKQAACRYVDCRSSTPPGQRLSLQFANASAYSELRPGSLDDWLLERYRLFLGGPNAAVLAADVEHAPWQAAAITPAITENTLAIEFGVSPSAPPAAAHYSPGVAARFGGFRTVAAGRGSGRVRLPPNRDRATARREPRPPIKVDRAAGRHAGQ